MYNDLIEAVEEAESCPQGTFSCDRFQCLSYDKRCDSQVHCHDGRDEMYCGKEFFLESF